MNVCDIESCNISDVLSLCVLGSSSCISSISRTLNIQARYVQIYWFHVRYIIVHVCNISLFYLFLQDYDSCLEVVVCYFFINAILVGHSSARPNSQPWVINNLDSYHDIV